MDRVQDAEAALTKAAMLSRLERHATLNKRLTGMRDDELLSRLQAVEATGGIGTARMIDVDGVPVFTKSLPLTAAESARPYATNNMFELPSVYHYGVGSAGFGAWRELAAHVKATQWVHAGDMESFPILYHYRVLPISGEAITIDGLELEEYVTYWNSNEQIRRYMLARQAATEHVVLFLEHVPHVARTWLADNLDRVDLIAAQMVRTLDFLREKQVGHFDAHLGNIIIDEPAAYLTDFGLVIDDAFELSPDERSFLASHRYWDVGKLMHSLRWPVVSMVTEWSAETNADVCARFGDATLDTIFEHLAELVDDGCLSLPRPYRDLLVRYRDVIVMMHHVFSELRRNTKRDLYDDQALGRALARAKLA